MHPLIIKRHDGENAIAHMYQADHGADGAIINDFTEILDKIVIDVYLKENIFSKNRPRDLNDDEKRAFVLKKRKELLKGMEGKEFELSDYLNSQDTTFRMTSCVKCNCLGIRDDECEAWEKEHPNGIYCERCRHTKDDFTALP